jgi:hypothetical protein
MPYCKQWHVVGDGVTICPQCGGEVIQRAAASEQNAPPIPAVPITPTAVITPTPYAYGGGGMVPTPPWNPAPPTYGHPGYSSMPMGFGPALPSVKGLAIAGMVLGIVSLVFFFAWFIGLVCCIVGVSLSGVALSRISKGSADPDGKGMAIAGLVTSIVSIVFYIFFIIFVVAVVNAANNTSYFWR